MTPSIDCVRSGPCGPFTVRSVNTGLQWALAERFCTLTAEQPDSPERLVGERMIGVSHYYGGDQRSARRHLERVLASYVPPDHKSHIIRFQLDQRVMAQAFLARVLWLQGFPDRAAMRSAESGIEDARATNHAVSVCHVLDLAGCTVALWAGGLAAAEHYGAMLIDHSRRHSLERWQDWGRLYESALVIKRGDLSTGLPLLRATLEEVGEASSAQADMTYRGGQTRRSRQPPPLALIAAARFGPLRRLPAEREDAGVSVLGAVIVGAVIGVITVPVIWVSIAHVMMVVSRAMPLVAVPPAARLGLRRKEDEHEKCGGECTQNRFHGGSSPIDPRGLTPHFRVRSTNSDRSIDAFARPA